MDSQEFKHLNDLYQQIDLFCIGFAANRRLDLTIMPKKIKTLSNKTLNKVK